MKFSFTEKQVVVLILLLTSLIFFINAYTFIGTYGGGDGMRHYLVSRYSWKHPEQLLYSWGKPFFTLISSPFSQSGLKGIKLFNSALTVLFAWIAYLIANKLQLKNAWIVVVFSLFSPLTVQTANSGLTEPMFALMIIFCAWLFMNEKYLWAAILISFLPFVRSEGNLILPLFAIILFIRKKFWLIPLLAFGTVTYSIVGYFYYHDILWIQTQNPYKGLNYDIYGQGPLLHYVQAYDEIFGVPLTILYVAGLPVLLWMAVKKLSDLKNIFKDRDQTYEELFLLHGTFIVYFVAHSIFWWKGLFGSLGLIRSMAGVVPLAAFTCLRGINLFTYFIHQKIFIRNIVLSIISTVVIFYAFKSNYFPLQLEPEEKVVQQVGDWYKTANYHPPKIYYLFPYLAHAMNFDAFDGEHVGELWGFDNAIKAWGLDAAVPVGTLVFWDAHFGANEAHIPLDSLMNSTNFKLIKSFKPDEPFKTLGGYDFEVYVFERIKFLNEAELNKSFFDLEDGTGLVNYETVKEGLAHSGKKSCTMTDKSEFSVTWLRNFKDMRTLQKARSINFKAEILTSNKLTDAVCVLSIDDDSGKNIKWDGHEIKLDGSKDWQTFATEFILSSDILKENCAIKIYIWNKGKKVFLVDDLEVLINQ